MRFRILSLMWVSAALAVPQVHAGELPAPAALGQMESLLDSCSKLDPKWASALKQQHEQLVQGVTKEDLAKVRAADDYKAAYKDFSDRYESVSKDEALKSCSMLLGTAGSPASGAK
jgi:hypothetical protein